MAQRASLIVLRFLVVLILLSGCAASPDEPAGDFEGPTQEPESANPVSPAQDSSGRIANGTHQATTSQIKGPSGGTNDGANCLGFRDLGISIIENATFELIWNHQTFTELSFDFSNAGAGEMVTGQSPLRIKIQTAQLGSNGFTLSAQPPDRIGVIHEVEITINWDFEHDGIADATPYTAGGC